MRSLFNALKRFHKDERGVTLVEYGIALMVVAVVGGAAMWTIANNTKTLFTTAGTATTTAAGYATGTTTSP